MNIYQLKRDPSQVQPNEYAGFIVRAANKQACANLVFENYSMERSDWPEEGYEYEFEMSLIATGVNGEPTILMVDKKPDENNNYIISVIKQRQHDLLGSIYEPDAPADIRMRVNELSDLLFILEEGEDQ